jgi:hypothetical protein
MAGMEDSVLMAQEYIVNDLISGKDFRGLGPSARTLVMAVASDANENAKILYGDKTSRTDGDFQALSKACQEQFVMDVLGFEGDTYTPQQAARRLVERVYEQYLDWAKQGAARAA